jgi:hypothetical protein
MDPRLYDESPQVGVTVLLKEFSQLDDEREPWRVVYPLAEVLLLLTCATIASCNDFDDIAAWGEHHLACLRCFAPFYRGIPCARWVRPLVNRIDPLLFGACFQSWTAALWPSQHDLIAIDGKTSRRTHDKRKSLKALHTLSAYASPSMREAIGVLPSSLSINRFGNLSPARKTQPIKASTSAPHLVI